MSIIEEMREKARDLQGVGEYWLAEHLEGWADRLAASVALVPVANGEACQPHELYPTQFVLLGGTVYVNHPGTRDLVDITNNTRIYVPHDETVQPVRLVAITGASI
jgi:hypothetical protein